jgi:hypothetical protein
MSDIQTSAMLCGRRFFCDYSLIIGKDTDYNIRYQRIITYTRDCPTYNTLLCIKFMRLAFNGLMSYLKLNKFTHSQTLP